MNLNHIDVSMTEVDFNRIIQQYAPEAGKVSKLMLDIKDGNMVITGAVKIVLKISFEVVMKLEFDDRCLIARLLSLKPLRLLGEKMKELILDKIVENMPEGISREQDALFFDVNKIISSRGMESDLHITSLRTANDAVTLELNGSMGFVVV
jgi:hypothetical protein